MIEFGMPTLIENRTLEENIALCKELGLSFLELNMNFPEYQIDKLEDTDRFFEKAEKENHLLTESCCTMLLYNLGYDINFIESGVNNIKITREEDLAAFSALVKE